MASSHDHEMSGVPRQRRSEFDQKYELSMKYTIKKRCLTTLAIGNSGKCKLVNYNFEQLVRVGALFTLFTRGTVFNLDFSIFIVLICYSVFFILPCVLLLQFSDSATLAALFAEHGAGTSLVTLLNNVQRYVPFLLGLFLALILSRWWAIRTNVIGAMMDGYVNIGMAIAALGTKPYASPEDFRKFEESYMRLLRLGVASLICCAKEARGQTSLDDLVDQQLLIPAERNILDKLPNRSHVLWCWICSMATQLCDLAGVPPPNHTVVIAEVCRARDGLGDVWAYLETQLPLPYVHMIVLLVNINNLVTAVVAGIAFATAWDVKDYFRCSCQLLKFLLVPTLYQGMLNMCALIADPMGDDLIDFPVAMYQLKVQSICREMLYGIRSLHLLRTKSAK